ncbi:MAG TPA: hypothetical protein VEQ42_05620, partial [Pyrinomonadaceae bacterium]|nr:hypothetical protein [Pyrinomonadaceae bacterium]
MQLPKKFQAAAASLAVLASVFTAAPASAQTTAPASMRDNAAAANKPIAYPATRRVEQFDDYHGVRVADPYRWLEDANSAETKAWVEAQNKLTFGYLGEIPSREPIRQRLTKLWNYERFGMPYKEGGRYFFMRNSGLQNQSVLYVVSSLDGEPRVLLDPNTLSKDGTVALSGYDISDDGKTMAYSVSVAGSDWQEIRVRNVDTAQDLPDVIKWVKFSSPAWTKDGKGFFYSRYDEPTEATRLAGVNYFQKLYFHRLGTNQSEDVLV